MPAVPLPNFSKGEIGSELYGRIDTQQYGAALKLCRNFVVQRYGGVTFRPGTRLVGKAEDPDQATKLIPFQSSFTQSYVMVFGQASMSLAALGGFVVEANTQITGIVTGGITVVEIPFHGYEVGDRISFSGIEGTVELNGRVGTVVGVVDADHVEVDIDSTGFGAFVSSDGTLNVGPPPAPPAPPVVPPVVPPPEPPPNNAPPNEYHWYYGPFPPWYIPPEF